MNAVEVMQALQGKSGQFTRISYQRPCKTRKGVSSLVAKRVVCVVRSGIDYSKLKPVQTAIANGERGQVEPLPWGQWRVFPYIIDHNGKEYVRLYHSPNATQKPSVEWTINGKPATLEQVTPLVPKSELPPDEQPMCFTITAEHILPMD